MKDFVKFLRFLKRVPRLSEEELIGLLSSKEHSNLDSAIDYIYREHGEELFIKIESYVNKQYNSQFKTKYDIEDIENFIQDGMFKACKSIKTYQKERGNSFVPWLYKIIKNVIIDDSKKFRHKVKAEEFKISEYTRTQNCIDLERVIDKCIEYAISNSPESERADRRKIYSLLIEYSNEEIGKTEQNILISHNTGITVYAIEKHIKYFKEIIKKGEVENLYEFIEEKVSIKTIDNNK